jgi:hypothetical protein
LIVQNGTFPIVQQIHNISSQISDFSFQSLSKQYNLYQHHIDLTLFKQPILSLLSFLFKDYFETRISLCSISQTLEIPIIAPKVQSNSSFADLISNKFNEIQSKIQNICHLMF